MYKFLIMKKSFITKTSDLCDTAFEILSSNELYKVRGGGDIKPPSRPKDIFDLDDQQR